MPYLRRSDSIDNLSVESGISGHDENPSLDFTGDPEAPLASSDAEDSNSDEDFSISTSSTPVSSTPAADSKYSSSKGVSQTGLLSKTLRQFIVVSFVFLAIILPLLVFITARGAEVDTFEADFAALALTVKHGIGSQLEQALLALDSMGVSATSYAIDTNITWPRMTLLDFDIVGTRTMRVSQTAGMLFMPLVTNDTRASYEAYTTENPWWLDTALQRQPSSGRQLQEDGSIPESSPVIYSINPMTGQAEPAPEAQNYFPLWQMLPIRPALVNYNDPSFGWDLRANKATLETHEAVLSELRHEAFADLANAEFVKNYYTGLLQDFLEDPEIEYKGEPVSTVVYPVFDKFGKDRELVAIIASTIFWQVWLLGLLPPNSKNGITCVFRNTCGDVYSLQVDGTSVTYLGQDDLHDDDFEYLEEVYHFSEVNNAESRLRISKTAVPLNADFCPLTLHLYPSKDLHAQHVTGRPAVFAFATFLAFIFVGLVSMTYDCVVQRRMRFILKHAKENRSLVVSLFPKTFRQRLLHDDEELDPVSSALAPSKVRLKSLLAHTKRKDSRMSDDDALSAKPIADLFPHCTVLFADVSGFSAWSSERSPEQVFTLLETIFQALDKVARRRRVFKVETVGDSYVAATGLPDPQPDHVVRIARFARDIMTTVNDLTKQLEATLGPDTGELKMRVGIHSGQVTAGVLRGEKERFQLFGDTMNMASRMESTGVKNRIQVSPVSAQLLIEAGKESWIIPREEQVQAKGKGVVQTYWMVNQANVVDDTQSISSDISRGSSTDYMEGSARSTTLGGFDQHENLWDDSVHNAALKHSSRGVKTKRLVNWLTAVISNDLKRLVAMRRVKQLKSRDIENATSAIAKKDMPLSEVVESFTMPTFKPNNLLKPSDVDSVELPKDVVEELRDFVSRMSRWYRFNSFHNFEHASHVTMSSIKLLSRIVTPENVNYKRENIEVVAEDLHNHTFGIISDPLAQFAVTFSALIHDVDHTGVPNNQVAKENPELGVRYKQQSIAEQNSVDIAWNLLMEPKYKKLQQIIFTDVRELQRFRQYVVNLVFATDIFNKDMKALRNERWDKAFHDFDGTFSESLEGTTISTLPSSSLDEASNLKATMVLEHIIQAADVSHTMQHWQIYKKWNEKLFNEMYSAYDNGRADKDPSDGWYRGELWFFDNYIIPLAEKLDACGVFGVSSDECLIYALENRKEWALKGTEIVQEMKTRSEKRKILDLGGYSSDEIESFTAEEMDYMLRRLIEKGRHYGTYKAQDMEGRTNAAKAWFHALELYELAFRSSKVNDPTLVYLIYSGLMVFLKGGMIVPDEEQRFELELADDFCKKASRGTSDPIHYARALALQCDVLGRHGRYQEALAFFRKLSDTYVIEDHSEIFSKAYGTDRAAQMYSQRAYWHHQLGDTEEATRCCKDVLHSILPKMDTDNVLNTFELLIPVIRLLKPQGEAKALSDLFEEHIMKKTPQCKTTLCRPVLRPLSTLLKICGNKLTDLNGTVEWLLDENNVVIDEFLDNLYSKLGWAPNSITAELYLITAKIILGTDQTRGTALLKKGLQLAQKVEKRLKDDQGVVLLPVAYEIHEPLMKELQAMADALGLSYLVDPEDSSAHISSTIALKASLGGVRPMNMVRVFLQDSLQ